LAGKLILNSNQNIESEKMEHYKIKTCSIPINTRIKTQIIYTNSKYREKHFPTYELKQNQSKNIQHIEYTLHGEKLTKIDPDYVKYLNQTYHIISGIPTWLLIRDLFDFLNQKIIQLNPLNSDLCEPELSVIISDSGDIFLGIKSNSNFSDYLSKNPITLTNPSNESKKFKIKISGQKIPSDTWVQTQIIYNGTNIIEKHFPGRVKFIKKNNWEKIKSYIETNLKDQSIGFLKTELKSLEENIPKIDSSKKNDDIIPQSESSELDHQIIPQSESSEIEHKIIPQSESSEIEHKIIPQPENFNETSKLLINQMDESKTETKINESLNDNFNDTLEEPKVRMTFKSRPKPNLKINTNISKRINIKEENKWIDFFVKFVFTIGIFLIGFLIMKYIFF
jgi:hypothetical protein